jgi:integrase
MTPSPAVEIYRKTLASRQLAESTKTQYLAWAERYVAFRREQSFPTPEEGITEFLSSLTPCSVANQRGALAALAGRNGLYQANGKEIGKLPEWVHAKRPKRIKVWVTQTEAEAIISQLPEPWNLVAGLMFGSGLRIGETINLRWRCFDFERGTVSIRSGKGDKDRITPLSSRMIEPLMARRTRCRGLWNEDRERKRPGVAAVEQLVRKYPSHGVEWPFFWVFPSAKESTDKVSGITRRHHLHDKSFAKALRPAVRRSGIDKRVTAHSFRHGFATAYLLAGGNIRELQERLGHESIETTMGYLHCIPQDFDRIGSPWDTAPARPQSSIIDFPSPAPAARAL